jgi:hypothetical protein
MLVQFIILMLPMQLIVLRIELETKLINTCNVKKFKDHVLSFLKSVEQRKGRSVYQFPTNNLSH